MDDKLVYVYVSINWNVDMTINNKIKVRQFSRQPRKLLHTTPKVNGNLITDQCFHLLATMETTSTLIHLSLSISGNLQKRANRAELHVGKYSNMLWQYLQVNSIFPNMVIRLGLIMIANPAAHIS